MTLFGKTFSAVVEEYVQQATLYTTDTRTVRYNAKLLLRFFNHQPIRHITPKDVEDMIAARLAEGVSRATCNRNRAALSKLFSMAIVRGHMDGPNPCSFVKAFPESAGRTRYLTPKEAIRLIDAAKPHLKPVIITALNTGGRLTEVLSLRWSDIDLTNRVLYFRQENTKSKRERALPIVDALLEALQKIGPGPQDSPVFSYHDQPIHSIRSSFGKARRKAYLGKDVTFHILRHPFASWFIQNGGDLNRLQTYMGHSSIALTQRYGHMSKEFLADGAQHFHPPVSDKVHHA